jgi:hypothetical protein
MLHHVTLAIIAMLRVFAVLLTAAAGLIGLSSKPMRGRSSEQSGIAPPTTALATLAGIPQLKPSPSIGLRRLFGSSGGRTCGRNDEQVAMSPGHGFGSRGDPNLLMGGGERQCRMWPRGGKPGLTFPIDRAG